MASSCRRSASYLVSIKLRRPRTVCNSSKREQSSIAGNSTFSGNNELLTSLNNHDITSLSSNLNKNGYTKTSHPILSRQTTNRIKSQLPKLFRGEFDTGIYPDEWHWREGISLPNAAREMCNSWKSNRCIASVVLNKELGEFVAKVMGWESVRIAQDDLVWKPPSSSCADDNKKQHTITRIDTVGFHQDSAYISVQFEPYENNSLTVWMGSAQWKFQVLSQSRKNILLRACRSSHSLLLKSKCH